MRDNETPEQYLIRQIREMQAHHHEILTSTTYPSGVDGILHLNHHKIAYNIMTDLINLYDVACEDKADAKMVQ